MSPFSLRSLLLAAVVISNCISWTASRHHHSHNLAGHKARHRRQQGEGLYLSASYVLPGGEGEGWGDWGDVSPCSRTCGGGVASQKRICLQFGPDGQPQCTGGDTKFFSCETQDCPAGAPDFREQQCSEFDDVAFRDIKYKWVPYTQAPNPCELNCMPHGERFYYRHRTKVVDGTRCNDESFDVCVNGTCQPVGCDMMLGSNAREDKCRECRGTGAYCHTTAGVLDNTELRKGYNDMLLIPEGATSIVIAERRPSNNYLALRAKNNTFYLNGEYHIDFPRSLTIAGALWYYERSQQGFAAPDKLRCLGPTNEPLILALLLQDENVGIDYEYSVPNAQAPPRNKKYNWVHDEFTPCSAPCGGGFQTRNVTCRSREELELVDEVLCDQDIKPPTNQSCNLEKCAAQWTPQPWGECSKRCGEGGIRSREVQCTQIISNGSPSIVADKTCFDLLGPKPALFEECNQNATCPVWFTGRWRPCDKLCDEGKQTRQVVCYQKNEGRVEVLKDSDCEDEKPAVEQPCLLQPCEGVDWIVSEWSGCDTCLSTVRTRSAVCSTKKHRIVNETFCAYHETPATEEPCDKTKLPPCDVQWYATQWSKCSADCGKGIQTRKVFCGLFDGASVLKVADSRCAGQPKYNESKDCEVPKEKCPAKWHAGPWTACTKECNGGEQFRYVTCVRGGEPATNCDGSIIPSTTETCNTGPCNEDELMPTSGSPDSLFLEDEDCVMEEELYEEVGLEEDSKTTIDAMFSDSPTDGSGIFTLSTAEHESTFDTESTLSLDELLSSVSSSSGWDIEGSGASSEPSVTDLTGSTVEPDTDSTSNDTESTDITGESTLTTSDLTDTSGTDDTSATSDASGATDGTATTESDYASSSSSEETEATDVSSTKSSGGSAPTEGSTVSGLTSEADTEVSTEPSTTGASDLTGETETSTTESGASSEPSTVTAESDTTNTETTETSDTSETTTDATDITETTETGSTDTSDTTEAESTTNEASTTESGTETTETSDTGSTESSDTTIAETTEATETTESGETSTTESGGTETTESGSSEATESGATETTESGSTESTVSGGTETTESGTTETTESESTETTESGSTETTESGSTETTESGSTETTESGGTETTESGGTETTESGATETTESGGTETTESGGTETTESGGTATTESGGTETTETTESGETETTESSGTESTTETYTGSTESTVSGETEVTETGSTESSEGTDSGSTTEAATGTTSWDLTTTVLTTKKPPVCKPRSCKKTKFGCCPDNKTAALGPFDAGCRKPQTCKESLHGCCPDGLSPAQGPANKGCPDEHCEETLFGCCESDGKTPAEGNEQEGCPPPPPPCVKSKYGCCKDETEAKGPEKQGCPETSTTVIIVTETEGEETTTSASEVSTGAAESCAESEFGCCFDNQTAAAGAGQQGCPCDATEFGCCPDGAPAQGPNYQGCVKSCNTSPFGCCTDGKTPAHGPDFEGCCLLTAFGCCPDNYKPAEGPHHEGCGCQFAQFGCCPDNFTVAAGPGNKGCGCQYADHGCCPDRHTEASGPNFEGCKCHTYQFGCCPDGETIAAGPNGQGCYCQHSDHGCCGDEQTHAKGPNRQGCDCSTSKYGCCLDGTTEATGPKFEGCADKPEDKQAMCGLKFERGPCRNYSVGWYYDTEYGGCSRFWYGGCEGNGNRFASKEECEATCVSPPAKDACRLPQIKGACLGYNVRWFFDTHRETCSSFVFGGCLGNNNNFESLEKCRAQCEPERATDQCSLSIERGRCAGAFPRWAYDAESKRCEQFLWGGCEGNTNRFSTEAACMLRCNPPGKPQPECSEPQNVGNCTDTEARWSFSQTEDRCVPFYHTGCGGNGNSYIAREECEEACPSSYVPELCTLPASTGDCSEYTEKWYFDTKDQRCRQFYYGSCGGNGNRFNSEQECASRCSAVTTTPAPAVTTPPPHSEDGKSDFCFLGIDPGPCNQLEPKWGYDYTRGKCVPFQFGGCGGNQNNFRSEDDCNYYCRPTQDICQLPMLSGPCDDSIMSWFYDAATDSCSQFAYGGCDGNDNRFASRDECESRCKTGPAPATEATTTTVRIDPRIGENVPAGCAVSPSLEPCRQAGEVWYFEPATGACAAHENRDSGDDCRNTGVFYSQEACERSCGAFRNIDVCRTPVEPGPCTNYVSKYHYNATSRRCEEFAYGGCLGGPNRFSTQQECEQICMVTVDPCTLEPEPGNCLGNTHMWFYHPNGQCYEFSYTGCGGNDNKFESREACEARCKTPAPTTPAPVQTTRQYQPAPSEECRTPESLEPCSSEYVFYFDEVKGECAPAAIGGCTTSNNVYRTEEECERRCGAFRGLDVCRALLDPGPCRAAFPKVYFDAASGACKNYTYGGCQGGPNRFSTTVECEEVCAGEGPAPACLAPISSGERCAETPGRRWHYDVVRADCIVFSYQGCGGSENNFRSYEECTYLCRVDTTGFSDIDANTCYMYAEECGNLEVSCQYGVRRDVAPEGCERCSCEGPADCEPRRRECEALACTYGVQRYTGADGCEACQCYEDPCVRMNCTSEEKCIATASRDPNTQEAFYSAQCVTNEIPDCEAYAEECSRLQCTWGVQRTRVGGCERCSCVPEEVDCSKLEEECRLLQCTYGMNTTVGNDGCTRCKCNNEPCANKLCPSGERCVAKPYPDPVTQEWRYSADCRTVNKPGVCPAILEARPGAECRADCRDDADCRGVLKCCARGCSMLCAPPEQPATALPSTTHMPDIPQAPRVDTSESKPEVAASEGGKATLRCIFHGNPPPKITWRFGEITIDSDEGRYRLLSDGALEIVSLFRNDSGVYICVGTNDLGTAEQNVTLTVADPVRLAAGIAGAAGGAVTGELGRPLVVRCRAYGYPQPTIYWYRANGGPMVPYSSPVFEARGNDLTIKRLALDTLGEYECQAYNGEGKAATWRVAVQAYRPAGDYSASPFLVAREPEVLVTPRAPPPAPYTQPPYAPPPSTTRQPEFDLPPQYTVPVRTSLNPASTTISAGAQLDLPCDVDGYPEPEVYWTKDDVRLQASDRLWLSNSRLTLSGAQVSDSGIYTCHASNAYSSHSSYVQITVEEPSIPASCVDNPTFANCALIVQSRFCVHKYYSKFCCESCVKAGQLDPRDALMQGDQPYWRRK